MILSKKIEDKVIYLKLSLLDEGSQYQDGFIKSDSSIYLPRVGLESTSHSPDKSESKQLRISHRYPQNNPSVMRIFDAICKGNWDEVNFSMRFVLFQDSFYNNQTAAIACLFCQNPIRRKMTIKILMKWKFNFGIPDLIFQRDPLHWCCILGLRMEFEMIVDYLNADVDYRKKDIDGNSYLHLAIMSNSLDLVKLILNAMTLNGVGGDISNSLGFTPYILSRKLGHREISELIQSAHIASLNVFDNMFYKSPREWSILGHNARTLSKGKLKVHCHKNLKTFQIPEITVENEIEPKPVDVNKIIHSAYIVWANQHVDSFRKLASYKEPIILKPKLVVSLPPVHKKSRVK